VKVTPSARPRHRSLWGLPSPVMWLP
jgi:hypothetical protein